ncbi:MAG: hypothetical protein ABI759_32530 [Candidatus Solibacter sp.]
MERSISSESAAAIRRSTGIELPPETGANRQFRARDSSFTEAPSPALSARLDFALTGTCATPTNVTTGIFSSGTR